MIIATLLILGASLLFFAVAFVAVLFSIVLPMREKLANTQTELDELRAKHTEQEDTIARNAWATIGLYMVNRREINVPSPLPLRYLPSIVVKVGSSSKKRNRSS